MFVLRGCIDNMDSEIEHLPNLGPASSHWLREVGITTLEDLERVGAVGAFLLVEAESGRPSLNLLWAMEGALTDTPWEMIPPEVKADLLEELESQRSSDEP